MNRSTFKVYLNEWRCFVRSNMLVIVYAHIFQMLRQIAGTEMPIHNKKKIMEKSHQLYSIDFKLVPAMRHR